MSGDRQLGVRLGNAFATAQKAILRPATSRKFRFRAWFFVVIQQRWGDFGHFARAKT